MSKKRLPQRATVLVMLFYSLLLSPLFFYIWVFDRPDLPFFGVMLPLYGFWIISVMLDMGITLSLKRLIVLHESNIIFRNLYAKYRPSVAILIQLLVEISFVVLIPSLIFPRDFGVRLFFDYQTSAVVAGIIGVIHVLAYHSNRKIIPTIKPQNSK